VGGTKGCRIGEWGHNVELSERTLVAAEGDGGGDGDDEEGEEGEEEEEEEEEGVALHPEYADRLL